MRTRLWCAVLLCGSLPALGQAPARRPARAAPRSAAAGAPEPQYKGIFEPVNYGQDINFTDVFFVSPDVGWVSGEHATLLKTTDGGAHWTAQIGGDPNGTEKAISRLRFLDSRHGWAVTDENHLLRTLDGENWEQIGTQLAPGSGFNDYAFTSVRHGIALGGNLGGFYVTNDGGRHWQNVAPCRVRAIVQGLPRTEDCRVKKLQMVSSTSGYASADWSGGLAFLRTDDGGQHWASIPNDVSECCGPDFFFTDLNHGVMVFNNGKTYLTSDGGKSWRALLSSGVGLTSGGPSPTLHFADPEVAWALGASPDNSDTFRVSYSTDSGQHWKMSHNIAFPVARSTELKVSFPRRDRAYVIGAHGMIYRYRVVPAGYSAANTLDAPLMPAFGAMELSAKADLVRRDIDAIRSKLTALVVDQGSQGAPQQPATSSQAATDSSAGIPASASPQPGSDAGQSSDAGRAAATGGFTQQSDVSATADAIASGNNSTSSQAAFTQDTSPPSDAVANCCAAAIQQLQSDTAGFITQVPQAGSQYRPMNLVIAGLQLAATLMNQGQSLWNQFKTLKHAPSIQAANAALQQLSTTLNTVQQASSSGLQNPGAWFAQNAPAAFTQDVNTGTAGAGTALGNVVSGATAQNGAAPTDTQAGQPAVQAQGSGNNQPQGPAPNSGDQTMDKAKQKIKSKLKWPPR